MTNLGIDLEEFSKFQKIIRKDKKAYKKEVIKDVKRSVIYGFACRCDQFLESNPVKKPKGQWEPIPKHSYYMGRTSPTISINTRDYKDLLTKEEVKEIVVETAQEIKKQAGVEFCLLPDDEVGRIIVKFDLVPEKLSDETYKGCSSRKAEKEG